MGTSFRYKSTADRPAAEMWLHDDDGNLIDFSSGSYSYSFKIGLPGSAALLTKTTNIAGAVGAGVEPTGTPNIVVTWAAGDLALTPGVYVWQLTATISGLDRVFSGMFTIDDVVT